VEGEGAIDSCEPISFNSIHPAFPTHLVTPPRCASRPEGPLGRASRDRMATYGR
jgi:hypothetical protein